MHRDLVFVSHATPEDNEFTQWLVLQLAKEGYKVWSDITRFLGGEDNWSVIEDALRNGTAKFLMVLSRKSNHKLGAIQELRVAKSVAQVEKISDFIVPLRIDDISNTDINIELSGIQYIDFNGGWAEGLRKVLKKLQTDNILRNPVEGPTIANTWWKTSHKETDGYLENQSEKYSSNRFLIESLPKILNLHVLEKTSIGSYKITKEWHYPYFVHDNCIVSFACAEDFRSFLPIDYKIIHTYSIPIAEYFSGSFSFPKYAVDEFRRFIIRLLNESFLKIIDVKQTNKCSVKNRTCIFLNDNFSENNKVFFIGVNGKRTWRTLVGFARFKGKDETIKKRYWHFGISAQPTLGDENYYSINAHVIFSSDGANAWTDSIKLQRARRSQCKNWWNPQWRDRLIAIMTYLADEDGIVRVGVGSDLVLSINGRPITFNSPSSYTEPQKKTSVEEAEEESDVIIIDGEDHDLEEEYSGESLDDGELL
jgi:hypothetical protein